MSKNTTLFTLKKMSTVAAASILLSACGGGGGGVATTTDEVSESGGDIVASAYELPEQLEIVQSGDGDDVSSSLSRSVSASRSVGFARAFSDSGTDYDEAEQHIHTWLEALQPVELVNTILCFTGQMNAEQMVGEDPYTVLIDMGECEDEGDSADSSTQTAGQSSSASGAEQSYVEAVIRSQVNSSNQVEVHAWVPEMQFGGSEEDTMLLKMKGVVTEGASEENPFGQFTLNWEIKNPADPDGDAVGYGEIATVETLNGFIGFTLYDYMEDEFGEMLGRASVVMREDLSDGVALTATEFETDMMGPMEMDGERAYAVSFNEDNILIQEAESIAELPYKNGGSNSSGTCLAKDSFKEAVWSYGMYDAETGDEIEVNGGFPIRYDSDDDGDEDSYGYVGYWGLWTEEENALSNGDTVVRDTFGQGEGETYTLVQSQGRLIKKEVITLDLAEVSGVDFYYWDEELHQDSGPSENEENFEQQQNQEFSENENSEQNFENEESQQGGYDQWIVRYEDGAFKKVAGMRWGENGPETTDLEAPVTITLEDGHPLFLHSDQLGGGVQYKQGDDSISFHKESFMTGTEEEFASNGEMSLVCADRCVKAGLTAEDVAQWEGGFEPTAETFETAYSYDFSVSGLNAMTLTSDGTAVGFPSGVSEDSPNFWGIQSGPMVTAEVAAGLSSPYDVYDPELVSTYYVWETGPNDWNKTSLLVDSVGDILAFDKPMDFSYSHTEAAHREGSANSFAEVGEQTFMLHYNGPGDLHGIPFASIGGEEDEFQFWYPLFNLNDGTRVGPNNEYVIKARDIERKMNEDMGGCSALVVNDPAAPVPTDVEVDLDDIGDVPEADEAPAFVGGLAPSDEEEV